MNGRNTESIEAIVSRLWEANLITVDERERIIPPKKVSA